MNELAAKKEDVTEFYDILDEIGSGQFAVVKKVIEKETGTEYAAKFMKKKRTKSRRSRGVTLEQITQEASVLRGIRHEGVIYLHDVFEAAQEYILVLELLNGGELFEFLSEQEYLTEEEAIGFARQVVSAVDYLHEKHIVHLDIKPENIVLKNRTETQVKLIDFGLARIITPGETVREIMGTPEFVAPEVIAFEGIGTHTDMWAVGVLAYILVSGASPFLGDSDHETYTNITNVDYDFDEELFGGISSQAKEFVSALLIKNPSTRMTSKGCLNHSWLLPEADFLRRRSTIIKTESFKEFTARARWKKTLKKVIAVNRMALLGKKDGPVAKNILFESDHYTSSDSETEMHHETCDHRSHNQPSSITSELSTEINAEKHKHELAQAENKPTALSADVNEVQSKTEEECNVEREAVDSDPASAKSGKSENQDSKGTESSGEGSGANAGVEHRSNDNHQEKCAGVEETTTRSDQITSEHLQDNHLDTQQVQKGTELAVEPEKTQEKELTTKPGNPPEKQVESGNPQAEECAAKSEHSQETESTEASDDPQDKTVESANPKNEECAAKPGNPQQLQLTVESENAKDKELPAD